MEILHVMIPIGVVVLFTVCVTIYSAWSLVFSIPEGAFRRLMDRAYMFPDYMPHGESCGKKFMSIAGQGFLFVAKLPPGSIRKYYINGIGIVPNKYNYIIDGKYHQFEEMSDQEKLVHAKRVSGNKDFYMNLFDCIGWKTGQ